MDLGSRFCPLPHTDHFAGAALRFCPFPFCIGCTVFKSLCILGRGMLLSIVRLNVWFFERDHDEKTARDCFICHDFRLIKLIAVSFYNGQLRLDNLPI